MKDVIVAVLACNSGRHAYISSKSSNSLLVTTSDIDDRNLSLLLWRIKSSARQRETDALLALL